MVSNGQRQDKKYWYKISVDAVRAWTTVLALLVIGIGGFWGYTLLSRHLLERDVVVAIEESEALFERLQTERDLDAHRERMDSAAGHLRSAKNLYDAGEFGDARHEAERCRTLLTSVANALRHRSPAGEAQFISTQGRVEVRRGERGEWRSARSRMVLHAGDYVKTASNGSAEIMMVDGTLFTVRPGTVLLVSRTRTAFGLRSQRTLSLESGWVNLSTAQTASRITTPEADATVGKRSEAVVTYDETEKVGSFASFRGGLRVASSDGSTRDVGELQQVVQSGGQLSQAKPLPEAPMLTEPADNIEFFLQSTDTVRLSWRPVKGASTYALQVSQNRLFVDNVIDVEKRAKTTATLGLKGEGSFLWRVAAFDDGGQQGPWSTIHRFRVGARMSQGAPAEDETLSQGG
ncbi:MAG: FecR domain-containing protein [Acidobacteriota bacterium]|nr:FecR domain-containing protein [Acidobacteriota bacterium]